MWMLKLGICAIVLVAIQASGDETPNEQQINKDLQLAEEETGTAPVFTEPATLLTEKEATYVYRCTGPLSAYSHADCDLTANNRVCYYQDTLYKYQSCAADCNGVRNGSRFEERCNAYSVCEGYLKNDCNLELENPPTKSSTITTTTPRAPTTITETKKPGSPKTSTKEGPGEDVNEQPISAMATNKIIVSVVVILGITVVVVLICKF
ncbi:uncharacterized protein [Watersipora subatra]|uniref:uncharacterized protein n=1 Tax=Watersipora subatra TaxID=2589382 RepID=UPI00355B8580